MGGYAPRALFRHHFGDGGRDSRRGNGEQEAVKGIDHLIEPHAVAADDVRERNTIECADEFCDKSAYGDGRRPLQKRLFFHLPVLLPQTCEKCAGIFPATVIFRNRGPFYAQRSACGKGENKSEAEHRLQKRKSKSDHEKNFFRKFPAARKL